MDNQPNQPYQPNNTQPPVGPPPVTQPITPLPQTPQAYTPVPAPAPMQPPKKGGLLWLWLTLAGAAVIAIAAGITLLVSLNTANSIAKEYNSSLKVYLEDVADAVSGSGSNPNDVAKDVDKVKKPNLKSSFMSGISSDYKKAEENNKKAKKVVATATDEAKLYGSLYELYTDVTSERQKLIDSENKLVAVLYAASPSESRFSAELDNMATSCTALSTLLKNAKVPENTKTTLASLDAKTQTVCKDIGSMKSAFDSKSSSSLTSAMSAYGKSGQDFETSYKSLKSEYENIASDVKELAKPVQELADDL